MPSMCGEGVNAATIAKIQGSSWPLSAGREICKTPEKLSGQRSSMGRATPSVKSSACLTLSHAIVGSEVESVRLGLLTGFLCIFFVLCQLLDYMSECLVSSSNGGGSVF